MPCSGASRLDLKPVLFSNIFLVPLGATERNACSSILEEGRHAHEQIIQSGCKFMSS